MHIGMQTAHSNSMCLSELSSDIGIEKRAEQPDYCLVTLAEMQTITPNCIKEEEALLTRPC